MNLLQGEKVISVSVGDKLTLTNYRVRYEYSNPSLWATVLKALQGGGEDPARRNRRYTSIFLEQITTIEYRYKSNWLFLLLATAGLLASLYLMIEGDRSERDLVWALLPVSLLFIILYFFSRKHLLSINTAKGSADVVLTVLHRDTVTKLVDQTDQAKNERVQYLFNIQGAATAQPAITKPRYVCNSCGAQNAEDDLFCMACGNKLN